VGALSLKKNWYCMKKKSKRSQICYRCENVAESSEHVPPKCFFPKEMRVNLFTVPSCKIHNEDTSKDDEYVRNIISMSRGVNEVGKKHFLDKGSKSLSKSLGLLSLTMKNPKKMNWIKEDDSTSSVTYEIDAYRFEKVMEKIAYGLYYHKFGIKWDSELTISTKHFVREDYGKDEVSLFMDNHEGLKKIKRTYGINPDVFQFCFFNFRENNFLLLLLKFYDFFEVWVVPKIPVPNKESR
jgi:hypothetical protein